MTCIATDGKTMVADGRTCADGFIVSESQLKLFHAKDGSVVGVAGRASAGVLARRWFEAGENFETIPNLIDRDDFAALILRPDGRVEQMGGDFAPLPYAIPAAIGTGDEIAVGAMLAGRSPAEAVRIAATRITTVGGEIVELAPKRDAAA